MEKGGRVIMSLISSAELTFVYLYLGFETIKIKKKNERIKNDLEVTAHSLISSWSTTPIRTGIWNCWFLRRGKTEQPEEQQQIQTPLVSLRPP